MKKNHAGFWVGIAVLFAAAVYSVILFLVKPTFDITAWVLYGATMVAFLLVGLQAVTFSRSGSRIVMDTALSIVIAIYFGLQVIFGGIVCMSFSDLPLTPVVVCEIVLLAAYLVGAFLIFGVQSSNAAQDQNERKTVQRLRLLENEVQRMTDEAKNPEVKKALKDLAEAIHFSDAVSIAGLADIESQIAQNIVLLQSELADEKADPLGRIELLRRLLKERDRTAVILKQ